MGKEFAKEVLDCTCHLNNLSLSQMQKELLQEEILDLKMNSTNEEYQEQRIFGFLLALRGMGVRQDHIEELFED